MLLQGKNGLVVGVANKRSIAWSVAESLAREGCRLAFNYQGERLEENVRSLAAEIPGSLVVPMDVTRDDEMDALFAKVRQEFGRLHALVHCVAFAPKPDLEGETVATSRDGFRATLDISAYSLIALARRAAPLMEEGGSVVALTYLGSGRVVPGYNVMGIAKAALESAIRYLAHDLGKRNIRVNGISAGPISTLAARGVPGFTRMLQIVRERAPLQRNTEPAEVGDTALFLCSHLSRGITGEIVHVDNGYHAMGM
jgi:enoyl-[acyl-carrier protein] reductase I